MQYGDSFRQAEMVSFHPSFEQDLMAEEALKFRTQFYDNSVARFNHSELFVRTVSIACDTQQMDLLVNKELGEGPDDFLLCLSH